MRPSPRIGIGQPWGKATLAAFRRASPSKAPPTAPTLSAKAPHANPRHNKTMQLTQVHLEIPEDLANRLAKDPASLSRAAL